MLKSFRNTLCLLVVSALFSPGLFAQKGMSHSQRTAFIKELDGERKQKDEEMRTAEKSPLPEDVKAGFGGLNYFGGNPEYQVKAILKRFDDPITFNMKTTTDRLPEYQLFGEASFTFKGKPWVLEVYQNVELAKKPGFGDYLFIPFNDRTNGRETYGGGRFLDARIPEGDTLIIDFNRAYNPYCAYNHKYSCPVPPEKNNLEIKIKAGEKKFHQ